MFAKGTKAHAIYAIIEALLLLTGGILALVFCNNKDAYAVALTAVGIVVVVSAALNLLFDLIFTVARPIEAAVMSKQSSITAYSLELALGIALIVGGVTYANSGYGGDILRVFNFAALFIGIALIVLGGSFAIYATAWVIRAPKELKRTSIMPYFLAIITITCGILVLCLVWNAGDDAMMKFLFIFAGIFLLLIGFFGLIGGILELVHGKKANGSIDNVSSESEDKE